MASGSTSEYRVKLAKKIEDKKYHVMRFKPPHKCDLEKLVNPTLDRQIKTKAEEEDDEPEMGEGSEYGRKRREEARRRRRGYQKRAEDPDDHPWVLREKKKGGKHFIGRKEGTVGTASSYFMFTVGQDGVFEVHPVENWYDFVPPVKYNYLDADEAEEKYEKRNNTLNYFSIMLSKKMRNLEEGEDGVVSLGDGKLGGKHKKEKKKASANSGLLLTDSDSGGQSDTGDSSADETIVGEGSNKKEKKKKKKKKKSQDSEDEVGEDTDEGEMESREVDYMSDSSTNSEQEFLAKKAKKEVPKDDEEVDRKEDGNIDRGFMDSSSSEDELTEKGKELKELINKLSGNKDSTSSEEEGGSGMEFEEEPEGKKESVKLGDSSSKKTTTKESRKRDRLPREPSAGGIKTITEDSENTPLKGGPPGKKQKLEVSTTSISEEEVKRYLLRRPITSKDLVKKFTSKKADMDRNKIVEVLHQIIAGLKNVEKQNRKGKLYLSLSNTTDDEHM